MYNITYCYNNYKAGLSNNEVLETDLIEFYFVELIKFNNNSLILTNLQTNKSFHLSLNFLKNHLKCTISKIFYKMEKTELNQKIGAKIRELRNKRGFKTKSLAQRIGVKKDCLLRYERGEQNIKASTLFRIAVILKYNIEDFFEDIPLEERSKK